MVLRSLLQLPVTEYVDPISRILSTLMTEAIVPSETLVLTRATEAGII
jgi:hypothetical protein